MISNAQNREDVILWRALHHVPDGYYVEVGASHPTIDSVSRVFYDNGWSGITVEPVPQFAELLRTERPRDVVVEAAISTHDSGEITLHVVPDTGLSTTVEAVSQHHQDAGIGHVDLVVPTTSMNALLSQHRLQGRDIHFLLVDVEGAEQDVLAGLDLGVWRPWVLVVKATAPNSTAETYADWEPSLLENGYEYCLFDGLSRYYVAAERSAELKHNLSYPASVWDDFETPADVAARHERDRLQQQVVDLTGQLTHWRSLALARWAESAGRDMKQYRTIVRLRTDNRRLRSEVKQLRSSTSWRVTGPLRRASKIVGRR